jgi:hypothetical protein
MASGMGLDGLAKTEAALKELSEKGLPEQLRSAARRVDTSQVVPPPATARL